MKGLIIKDLYELIKQCRFVLLLCLIYMIISIMGESSTFFLAFAIVFISMLPITVMAYDEKSKWDSYAITMPYTRKEMVLSKYILSLIGIFSMSILYLILRGGTFLIIDGNLSMLPEMITSMLPMILVAILFSSVNFPIIFKFGAEKGRLAMIILCALVGGIFGATAAGAEESGDIFVKIFSSIPNIVYPIAAVVLLMVSFLISVKVYEKREL